MQQIIAQNPGLAQVLAQNPDALFQLLGGGPGEGGMEDDEGPIPPGATVINITPEEQAAIQRVGLRLSVPSYLPTDIDVARGPWIPASSCY